MPVFLIIFITALLLSLAALDIRVGITAEADVIKNSGGFKVRVFGIPVYSGKFHAESRDPAHNALIVEHKEKRAEIHLNADKGDRKSVARLLSNPLFAALRIKRLVLDVRIGAEHDPFFTTLAFGSARVVLYSALSYIKSRYGTEISESFTPDYHANRLELTAYVGVYVSPGGILFEFARRRIRKIKMTKNKVKQIHSVNNR